MGMNDVVKSTIVVAQLVATVISGQNMVGNPAKQLEEWSRVQTNSWISQGLTESAVSKEIRRKASNLR
jgi:hypothetical protein